MKNVSNADWDLHLMLLLASASQCGIHAKQECYPLAFGVPAILMAVALGR